MKLNKLDIERALKLLPSAVQSVMIAEGTILAGGFLRCVVTRERIKDVDLFSKNAEASLAAAKYVNSLTTQLGEDKVTTTKNAHSIKNVEGKFVQFIHRWGFPDPESLLKSFDFTIASAAMWYDSSTGWDSLVDDEFYEDVAARRLNFKHPDRQEDPAGSLIRVLKFVRKGYSIPSESLAGVVARVAKHAERVTLESSTPYEALSAPYGQELIDLQEKKWTRIIHSSIATVTGES